MVNLFNQLIYLISNLYLYMYLVVRFFWLVGIFLIYICSGIFSAGIFSAGIFSAGIFSAGIFLIYAPKHMYPNICAWTRVPEYMFPNGCSRMDVLEWMFSNECSSKRLHALFSTVSSVFAALFLRYFCLNKRRISHGSYILGLFLYITWSL